MKRLILRALSKVHLFDLDFFDEMVADARAAQKQRGDDEAKHGEQQYMQDMARWLNDPAGYRRPQPGWHHDRK